MSFILRLNSVLTAVLTTDTLLKNQTYNGVKPSAVCIRSSFWMSAPFAHSLTYLQTLSSIFKQEMSFLIWVRPFTTAPWKKSKSLFFPLHNTASTVMASLPLSRQHCGQKKKVKFEEESLIFLSCCVIICLFLASSWTEGLLVLTFQLHNREF